MESYCTESRKAVFLPNIATEDELRNCDSKYLAKNCFSAFSTVRLHNEIHLHQCLLPVLAGVCLVIFFLYVEKTRPIRPTMSPHDDEMIVR